MVGCTRTLPLHRIAIFLPILFAENSLFAAAPEVVKCTCSTVPAVIAPAVLAPAVRAPAVPCLQYDAPALSFQQPMISAESINTRTITCNITFETVSHCQMKPNATLDSVVQEWYDLYRYELTEEQIHIK